MAYIERIPVSEPLREDAVRTRQLEDWLNVEWQDALSARTAQEAVWAEAMRQYKGTPRNPIRNTPVEALRTIEITVGATVADMVYAQSVDYLFALDPPVTVRPNYGAGDAEDQVATAKAVHDFANWSIRNEMGFSPATRTSLLDCVKLGSSVLYIPFSEQTLKTARLKTVARNPLMKAVPIEDFVVPGGCEDLHSALWCGYRQWLTQSDMNLRAKLVGWNIEKAQATSPTGYVRNQRTRNANTREPGSTMGNLYEVGLVWAHFDYDDDGIDEDLLIAVDLCSRNVLKVRYNPFVRRPFESMAYQAREHSFYGIGVMEMGAPYQDGITEFANHWMVNAFLANIRMWKAPYTDLADTTLKVWPNRVLHSNNPDAISELKLSDTYPSSPAAISMLSSFLERRVGASTEFAGARPSSIMGSRTPGITALSFLQASNRRFAAAFDNMRTALGAAAMQGMYRYQERLFVGDTDIEEKIKKVMGQEQGALVVEALKQDAFDNNHIVEMTVSSASVNKEADRQNGLLLVQHMTNYYQKSLELMGIVANPASPPEVREVARKIAAAAGELIERTLRTFDQIRDPERFIIEMDEEIDSAVEASQNGLAELQQMLGMAGGGGGMPPGGGAGLPDLGAVGRASGGGGSNPTAGQPPAGMQ